MTADFTKKGRILVVEDDPGIALLERAALRRAGYDVDVAGDVKSAESCLLANPPDLLLLDYWLADGACGLEWYRELQQRELCIPAILVSGLGDESRIVEAIRAGVCDLLPKTPNLVEMVAPAVDRVLKQRRQEQRLRESEAACQAKDRLVAALSAGLHAPWSALRALIGRLQADERLPLDVRGDLAHAMAQLGAIDEALAQTPIPSFTDPDPQTVVPHTVLSCNGAAPVAHGEPV